MRGLGKVIYIHLNSCIALRSRSAKKASVGG